MARDPELSRCPFCKARGVRIVDRPVMDGFVIFADYCGKCGKNYPRPRSEHEPPTNVLRMPEPTR